MQVPERYAGLVQFTPPKEEWRLVTPALARSLAAAGEDSDRKIYRARYMSYGKAMLGGRWRERAADSIHINDRDHRVNGQHRMLAVLWASEQDPQFPGVKMRFTYEMTDADTLHIDTGMGRSPVNRAQMRGEKNATLFSAILGRAIAWESGYQIPGAFHDGDPELENEFLVKHHEALNEAVTFGNNAAHAKPKTATGQVYGFGFYLLSQIDREEATRYLTAAYSGLEISDGDPAGSVRNTFLRMRNDRTTSLNSDVMFCYLILGWNNTMRGRPTKYLRLPWDARTGKAKLTAANFPPVLDKDGTPFVG